MSKTATLFVIVSLCLFATPAFTQVLDQEADWGPRGSNKVEGSVEYSGGTYTLQGNGDDIWNQDDEGFYVYTEQTGSFQLSGFLEWVDPGGNDWAKLGVMIREDGQDAESKHYSLLARGLQDQINAQMRLDTGISSTGPEVHWPDDGSKVATSDGLWVRITRIAELDYAYCEFSSDGDNWVFGHSTGLVLEEPVAVGFAITNHDDNTVLAEGTVSDVELTTGDDIDIPDIVSTEAIGEFEGQADIGYFRQVGSGTHSGGTYTIQGGGADIWGSDDDFRYVFQERSGNFDAEFEMEITQVAEPTWTKIGAMVRQDLGWSSPYGFTMIRSDGDFQTAGRNALNSGAYDIPLVDINGTASAYRLRKIGDTVTGYYQDENGDWQLQGSVDTNIEGSYLFGFAVTSHDQNQLAEGEFSNLQTTEISNGITSTRSLAGDILTQADTNIVTLDLVATGSETTENVTITENVPDGWEASSISNDGSVSDGVITWEGITLAAGESQELTYELAPTGSAVSGTVSLSGSIENPFGTINTVGTLQFTLLEPVGIFDGAIDVGAVGADGSSILDGDAYFVEGSGADIWGTADEFQFVFKKMTGAFIIRSEEVFLYQDGGDGTWTKVGLMVRDNLTAGSPHYNQIIRTDFEMRTQWRDNQDGASDGGGDSVTSTDDQLGYMEIQRLGNELIAYTENHEGEKTEIHSRIMPNIGDPVYVGLAVTSHNDGSLSQGEFLGVDIVELPFSPTMSVSNPTLAPGESTEVTVMLDAIREGVEPNFTVTQNYPTDTTVLSNLSTDAGTATDDGSGSITWEIDEEAESATMTYTLTAMDDALGTGTISGTYSDNADFSGDFGDVILAYYNFEDPDLSPFAWHMDLADNGAEGDVGRAGDNWGIIGSGGDIWGTSDRCHYLYTRIEGDFKVTIENAFIDGVGVNPSSNDWEKFGIMARQSLDSGAAMAIANIRGSDQAFMLQWREEAGIDAAWDGDATLTTSDEHTGTIILSREDDFFISSFIDANGEEVVNNEHPIIMDDPIYIGLAVTSHDYGLTSIGTFSNATIEGNTVPVKGWMLY